MIAFAKYQYPIVYMPLEARRNILPKHSICFIAPSEERSDHMITANGSHWMDIVGHPYEDEHIFRQEMLYRPQWKETPMPPDMRPVLPKLRKLLLEGKNEEIVTLINDVQSKTVAGKYMTQSAKFRMSDLKKAVEQCVEAEEAVKTGRLNDVMSLEILIMSVFGGTE